MRNLDLLKNIYQLFAEGDMEGVLALWDENIVWNECKGFPFVHGDGIYNGHKDIVEGVLAFIPEYYNDFSIEISDYVDGGERIVMVGYYTGVWKPTRKRFKANATHTWTFKNEKAVAFFQAVDSAAIIK